MINLLVFLTRYGGMLTFLLLGGISLYLVVRYNQTQRAIWINSSQYYSGVLLEKTNRLKEYSLLLEVADSLAQENALLYTRLYHQLAISSPESTPDSLLSQFEMVSARIIKNSIHLPNNNITLDKGTLHGVVPGMGVILNNGVLGIVRSATPRFSRVMSVLNTRTFVSGTITRAGAFGTLNWTGQDPGILIMQEVPKHIQVQVGDTVVTSGHSAIFPAGIPIGVVRRYFIPSGSHSLNIEVKLFADLARTNRAYIVRNKYWEEIRQLENDE